MSESYFGCCGRCVHCNLYDHDSWSGKFWCEELKIRVLATEEKCTTKWENDPRRTAKDIDLARVDQLR